MAIQLKDRVKTGFSTVGVGDLIFGATRENFQGWGAIFYHKEFFLVPLAL